MEVCKATLERRAKSALKVSDTGGHAARHIALTRCLHLLGLLLEAGRRGLTIAELTESGRCSRATLYRDLRALREAGLPLENSRLGGEPSVYRLPRRVELVAALTGLTPQEADSLHRRRKPKRSR